MGIFGNTTVTTYVSEGNMVFFTIFLIFLATGTGYLLTYHCVNRLMERVRHNDHAVDLLNDDNFVVERQAYNTMGNR